MHDAKALSVGRKPQFSCGANTKIPSITDTNNETHDEEPHK
jgi:hypothetical protein